MKAELSISYPKLDMSLAQLSPSLFLYIITQHTTGHTTEFIEFESPVKIVNFRILEKNGGNVIYVLYFL